MAGRGPAPDPDRVRRGAPARGDWTPSPDGGWQHEWPEPPPGLLAGSVEVWGTWLRSWWASNWSPDDLPVLRLSIRLYDRVMRGDVKRLPELRQWLDSLGITVKGRQDRRWQPPVKPTRSWRDEENPYAHLRITDRPVKERFATTPDEQGRWAVREVDDRRRDRDDLIAEIEQAHHPSAGERLSVLDPPQETTMTPTTLTVEQVPLDALHPDPANPRRIGDDELDALTRSMRTYGAVQPVLARREDGVVIGGHQRLVAARRLGWTTVPVTYLDLTTEQARLLNLALNRISGSWDDQLLARLLADLGDTPDVDLSLSGFGEDEVKELLRRLDIAERRDRPEAFDLEQALEEAAREPRTSPGDLWLLGEHRLLCGDATDPDAVARLLAGAAPRLLATDPPYGVSLDPPLARRRPQRPGARRAALHAGRRGTGVEAPDGGPPQRHHQR